MYDREFLDKQQQRLMTASPMPPIIRCSCECVQVQAGHKADILDSPGIIKNGVIVFTDHAAYSR
jgi:hypothetical protein